MTDTQLLHKANGILRIRQAIKNCDLPVSEVGTMFTPRIRFKHRYIIPLQKAILNSKYTTIWDKIKIDASIPPINISMDEIQHIEPVPLKSGDKRVIVNGRPLSQDFRIIHEEQYQLLISNIKNIKIIRNF